MPATSTSPMSEQPVGITYDPLNPQPYSPKPAGTGADSGAATPPITTPPPNPVAQQDAPKAPSVLPGAKGSAAASVAYGIDAILRGYIKGQDYAKQKQAFQANRLLQGFQYSAKQNSDEYLGILQNSPETAIKLGQLLAGKGADGKQLTPDDIKAIESDPNVIKAQQADAKAYSSWVGQLKVYGNYINPPKKTKGSKGGDQSAGKDQENPIELLQSQNPQDMARGYLMISHKVGPPWRREAAYLMSPQYQQSVKTAQGQQSLAGMTTDTQLDTAKWEKAEREGTLNQDDKKKLDAYRAQSNIGEEGKESAQIRGMRSGLEAVGVPKDQIQKVIASHYGGAGMRGTTIQQKYADAVQDAVDNGRDPNTDPATQQLARAIASEHPAAERAVTLQTPDGKKVAGKVNHEGDLLLEDGSKAPAGSMLFQQPSYASVAGELQRTKTITKIDDRGIPTIWSWNPQTRDYDIPQGTSAAGAYGHEMAQAGAVSRAGGDLIKDIQANREQLGTILAWVKKHGINTPIGDPKLAGLQSELKTFAALQPAMHGFRSRSAQEAFENIIGDLQKNPDATIASIQGILKTAGAINPSLGADSGAQGAGAGGNKRKRNPAPPIDPNDPLGILKP